jgi:hypothetical protein
VIDLARDAHLGGEVGGADQQAIDPLDGGDGLCVADRLRAFDHCDQQHRLVERGLRLGVAGRAETVRRRRAAP